MDTIFRFSGTVTARNTDYDFQYFVSYAPDLFPTSNFQFQAIYNINTSFVIDGGRAESSALLIIRDEDAGTVAAFDGAELEVSSSTFSLPREDRDDFNLIFGTIILDSSNSAALNGPDLPQQLDLADFDERAFIEIDARSGDLPDRTYQVQDFTVDRVQFGQGATAEQAKTIALLYETSLNRDGNIDFAGLNFWIDSKEQGLSDLDLAQFFLNSDEFAATFGSPDTLTDLELVETLYRNVLDRDGDQGGIDFWTGTVADPDYSRAQLLTAFAISNENQDSLQFIDSLTELDPGVWDFTA